MDKYRCFPIIFPYLAIRWKYFWQYDDVGHQSKFLLTAACARRHRHLNKFNNNFNWQVQRWMLMFVIINKQRKKRATTKRNVKNRTIQRQPTLFSYINLKCKRHNDRLTFTNLFVTSAPSANRATDVRCSMVSDVVCIFAWYCHWQTFRANIH